MSIPKQCPFCGWWEIVVQRVEYYEEGQVCFCTHCHATAPEGLWNNRPIEEGLMARIYELEDRIKRI